MLSDARKLGIFTRSLRRYLRTDLDAAAERERLTRELATREQRFLAFLSQAVYARPGSPYRALLGHAGIEHGDVHALCAERGLEGALGRLRAAGVHVSPEELKGRSPIVRGSLVLEPRIEDFLNPFVRGLPSASGGSSGRPAPAVMTFDDLVEDAGYVRLWVAGAGLDSRPFVLWRAVPPARSGLRGALRSLRTGLRLEHWLSPTPVEVRSRAPRDVVALRVAWALARAHGSRLPWPRHVPLDEADEVAGVLARLAAEGRPAVLDATAGAVVRACRAAVARGLDLSGTVVRTGGEPLTAAKAEAIAQAGARPACHYAAHEVGRIGVACADAAEVDDVHVALGRVAVVAGEASRILISSISATTPRVLLNADIGDTGVLVRRACGCPAGAAGLDVHVHTIRAAAKITTDGTSILHGELLELVERVLPARFGGGPTDYQLVEAEEDGVPRLHVVVSPRVGPVDEPDVVSTVLATVAEGAAWRAMTAGVWRDGGTVRVRRREPYRTAGGKLHAFHSDR